ncbi:NfrA family protein [Plesiomonas shigelloides]|uniref:NfrA family protein n=1 Tax=Plesiomonas shigelloides TaxID=703 RepID=UPI0015B65857|nr:tetratricopeptide repeat protein [Plesiomonas shigelloides]
MSLPYARSTFAVMLYCALSGTLLAAETPDAKGSELSAPNWGMSDYHYFISYPHLQKAMQAMKNNDAHTAITQFEHVHREVPDNIAVTLYLAEAYRHFGRNEQAVQLLQHQLKRAPGNRALRQALDAIPIPLDKQITRTKLLAQKARCDQEPTLRCRAAVGQAALHLSALNIAAAQLQDPNFANSAVGHTLRADLQQRAIYLKQWQYVEPEFNALRQQGKLTAAQAEQWFQILLLTRDYNRLQQLQAQGVMNSPAQRLAYASELAQQGQHARLRHYLAQTPAPAFTNAQQEQGWLYLLSRYSTNPQQAVLNFPARFSANQQWIAQRRLEGLMQAKDYSAAQTFLANYPANQWLETRFSLSLQQPGNTHSLALAQQLYRQQPSNSQLLDTLTYRLLQAGKSAAAIELLLLHYPFQGPYHGPYNRTVRSQLATRLFELLDRYPQYVTPAVLTRLSRPQPDVNLRLQQASWLASRHDCAAVTTLLGNLSPAYPAASWDLLGNCYQKQLPGLALYAYQQSEQRRPSHYNQLAIAYQAAAVQNYPQAEHYWQQLPTNTLSDEDLLAAASTAQAVGNATALGHWLSLMQQRSMGGYAGYWWLTAQHTPKSDPQSALSALDKAIHLKPLARFYAARAVIWQQLKQPQSALADLRQAHRMEPDNADYQAALGYALLDEGDYATARTLMRQALHTMPDDPGLIRQLAYVNQRLGDDPQTLRYAAQAIADISNAAAPYPLSPAQQQEQFSLRRLYTDTTQRWTFSADSLLGLQSSALTSTNSGSAQPGRSYRSYGQLEASYRIGRNQLRSGDTLFAYSRVFAGSGENGNLLPVNDPMLGAGIRWKPFFSHTFYLAAEQQIPLTAQSGKADVMLRASASLLNGGKFSDDWHPNGKGWFAQNLYLDAAYYVRQNQQSYTADYRASWHQKIATGQTVEPYAHIQYNSFHDELSHSTGLTGVGVRWNIWSGQTRDKAWPNKVSVGLEYQHTFSSHNPFNDDNNSVFMTLGGRW